MLEQMLSRISTEFPETLRAQLQPKLPEFFYVLPFFNCSDNLRPQRDDSSGLVKTTIYLYYDKCNSIEKIWWNFVAKEKDDGSKADFETSTRTCSDRSTDDDTTFLHIIIVSQWTVEVLTLW
jgi:hypothetical protein